MLGFTPCQETQIRTGDNIAEVADEGKFRDLVQELEPHACHLKVCPTVQLVLVVSVSVPRSQKIIL